MRRGKPHGGKKRKGPGESEAAGGRRSGMGLQSGRLEVKSKPMTDLHLRLLGQLLSPPAQRQRRTSFRATDFQPAVLSLSQGLHHHHQAVTELALLCRDLAGWAC